MIQYVAVRDEERIPPHVNPEGQEKGLKHEEDHITNIGSFTGKKLPKLASQLV
jgi:hypothetical protein